MWKALMVASMTRVSLGADELLEGVKKEEEELDTKFNGLNDSLDKLERIM